MDELALDAEARALLAARGGGASPGVLHWLQVLLARHAALAAEISPDLGDPAVVRAQAEALLARGQAGDPLSEHDVLTTAAGCARLHGGPVTVHDLADVILTEAGFAVIAPDAEALSDTDCHTIYLTSEALLGTADDPAHPTPLLDALGVDLTAAARAGNLSPIVEREAEITLVIETLCRVTKRNPALIGPAGVGKTAIVEGVAQRVAAGAVPPLLQGLRIVMLPVAALVAGCKFVGEFEERMAAVLREASRPEIVLFIDEAHTMIGAGAAGRNGNDLANLLKPALARGDIACIAATTDEEYRQFIEADAALERRFQPIRVAPFTPAQTLVTLHALRDRLTALRGVAVGEDALRWLVSFADLHLPGRQFPDKAVDLLEQCVAYGVLQGRSTLTPADVETVAQRLVGMPLDVEARLAALARALADRTRLPHETITALLDRLTLTLYGCDLRANRPNAVLLLTGAAAEHSPLICEVLAESLFDDPRRVITLDLARIATPADLTLLIGAPPGYVGFGGRVALHDAVHTPWCVLHVAHPEAGHPLARDILAGGLDTGVIDLADGKHVYLTDMVVVLAADTASLAGAPLGFTAHEAPAPGPTREALETLLGEALPAQADVLCDTARADHADLRRWLRESLLRDLCGRFRAHNIHLTLDAGVAAWVEARGAVHATPTDWERIVEQELCPLVLPYLHHPAPAGGIHLHLVVDGEACRVTRREE